VERYSDAGDIIIVALEFTRLETPGGDLRFYADLLDVDRREGAEMVFSTPTRAESGRLGSAAWDNTHSERIWTHEVPGVGTFFVRGSRLSLPSGFQTMWKTQLYRCRPRRYGKPTGTPPFRLGVLRAPTGSIRATRCMTFLFCSASSGRRLPAPHPQFRRAAEEASHLQHMTADRGLRPPGCREASGGIHQSFCRGRYGEADRRQNVIFDNSRPDGRAAACSFLSMTSSQLAAPIIGGRARTAKVEAPAAATSLFHPSDRDKCLDSRPAARYDGLMRLITLTSPRAGMCAAVREGH